MAVNSQFLHIHKQDPIFIPFAASQTMKRILLVDSQAHVLRVMKSTLDRRGYEVETAMSADLALAKIRESCFDVLIIDNDLETLDGQQLIFTIEDQFSDRTPAMFLLTDHNADSLQQWCTQFDRTECMEKPISLHYLDDRLVDLLGE